MSRLIINGDDFAKKLNRFELKCRACDSDDVTLDIEMHGSQGRPCLTVTVICNQCQENESESSLD